MNPKNTLDSLAQLASQIADAATALLDCVSLNSKLDITLNPCKNLALSIHCPQRTRFPQSQLGLKIAMIKKYRIATLLLVVTANIAANTVSSNAFFSQLSARSSMVKHTLDSYWQPNSTFLINTILNSSNHRHVAVSAKLLKKASGVNGDTWQFNKSDLNQHFAQLFRLIVSETAALGLQIRLSDNDLFHGHIFSVRSMQNQKQDMGILFHAKEYPRDLAAANHNRGINSPFTTHDQSYKYRNLIWLASTGKIYDLDGDSLELYPSYFLPNAWNIPVDDPDLGQITKQFLQARTFLLERLSDTVTPLGDINLFITSQGPQLFFTYNHQKMQINPIQGCVTS